MKFFFPVVAIVASTYVACAQSPIVITPLEVGAPISSALATAQRHSYAIAMDAGSYVTGVVQQLGIDVVVETFAPDGKRLLYVDSPNGDSGPEPFTIAATSAGTYRIDVSPLDSGSGMYEIRGVENLTALEYAQRIERARVADATVVSWMNARAIPARDIDGLVFIRRTSRARPNPSVHNVRTTERVDN